MQNRLNSTILTIGRYGN